MKCSRFQHQDCGDSGPFRMVEDGWHPAQLALMKRIEDRYFLCSQERAAHSSMWPAIMSGTGRQPSLFEAIGHSSRR